MVSGVGAKQVREMQRSAGEAGQPRTSETVLLVEDEQIVRQVVREILEMQGYSVLEAANGKEAMEVCKRYASQIDLVITDVIMPQMGGRELVEKLRPLLPEVKVLYVSGYTDDAIAHHGVLDEGTYFLEKPFDTNALAKKVRQVLGSDGAKGQA